MPVNTPNQVPPQPHCIAGDEVYNLGVANESCATAPSISERPEILPDATDHLWAPSLTTKPVIEPQQPVRAAVTVSQARSLGNVQLSVMEINELFAM
jgi:hypothetical protein